MLGKKIGSETGKVTSQRVLANSGGNPKMDGSVSYRGAVYYQSASPVWSRLNSVAAIFEFEVDTQGNCRDESWEWK